jgi:hypothetical protein
MAEYKRRKPSMKAAKRPKPESPPAPSHGPGRVSEAAVDLRRKNFDLDQHLLDRVRVALGARTEREAITRAMDIALDFVAFRNEVAAGSRTLFGAGGFENDFDDPDALDFSGFAAPRATPGGH